MKEILSLLQDPWGQWQKYKMSWTRSLLCTSPWLAHWGNIALDGWEDHDFRIGYKNFLKNKNNQFLPMLTCLLASLFPLCFCAEQYYCYFCVSSVKLPHHSHTSSPHCPGCPRRTQQSQRHCQSGTIRNILPTLAEGHTLWRAAEQAFYCCLQFNTQL